MSGSNVHASTEGLPKQFVTSLRILFDILDEERTGFVRLVDIESRWHEEGVRGLPSGVIDSLRKVAPKTGRLNFDTFVAGLKLSLLRNNQTTSNFGKENKIAPKDKPQSAPARKVVQQNENLKLSHDQQKQSSVTNTQANSRSNTNRQLPQPSNTATVRPNNVLQSQNIELRNQIYNRDQMQQSSIRQNSKVDQSAAREKETNQVFETRNKGHYVKQSDENYKRRKDEHVVQKTRPKSVEPQRMREVSFTPARQADIPHGRPERPPSYRSLEHHDGSGFGRPDRPPPYRKALDKELPPAVPPRSVQRHVMQELKQWQKEQNMGLVSQRAMHTVHSDSKLVDRNNGNDIYVNIDQIRQQAATFKKSPPANQAKGTTVRRQNSRRHTLSSGIDYNVIHRMKQLEKEKDELLQGLEVVDRAREWYLAQIATLTEKQHFVDKVSCSDMTIQANQERLNFIRSRINEVNLNLRSLMETTEKGFPAHMNLAMRSNPVSVDSSSKWLKEQNKQLTKEVGNKSEKITQLEKEKATLIRDLFEARSRHKTNYDDTTFM